MGTGELEPRSEALKAALGRSKETNADDQVMLNVREACRRLQVSKFTLYRLMQSGRLGSVKIGRRRLISQRALNEFIRQLEEEAEA